MKTNVSIELDDEARSLLANKIDGKCSARMATRKEVSAVCLQTIEGLVHHEIAQAVAGHSLQQFSKWSQPLPGDETILKGKSPGFIYGWNKVRTHNFTRSQ